MKSLYTYIIEKCSCDKDCSCNKKTCKCEKPDETLQKLEKIVKENSVEISEEKKTVKTYQAIDEKGNIVINSFVPCFSNSEIKNAVNKFKTLLIKDCFYAQLVNLREQLPEELKKLKVALIDITYCHKSGKYDKGITLKNDSAKALLSATDPASDTCPNFYIFIPKTSLVVPSSPLAQKTIQHSIANTFKNVFSKLK